MKGKTGGIRMKTMMDSGKINRGGQFIDLYNQTVYDGYGAAITTRIDSCNHYWVTVIEDGNDKV